MRKFKIADIKVGDLVEYKSRALGIVTHADEDGVWGYWSDEEPSREARVSHIANITGHWKVINFEEEAKMDELKVYTGKDTIEALLEGKTLEKLSSSVLYRFEEGKLLCMSTVDNPVWSQSTMGAQTIMTNRFKLHEKQLPQVGDWVRVHLQGKPVVGCITNANEKYMWANWTNTIDYNTCISHYNRTWQILSPEQVSEYKREQAFVKVGRKPNEFREGDIVLIDTVHVVGIVTSKINTTEVKVNKFNEAKGYTAKPHQLTPISFAENQVSLD